jgi:D-alanyl-D-alanine carboxypeptidase (penicillin-binding protein 5/6)
MKKFFAALAASVVADLGRRSRRPVPAPTIAAKSWLLLDATSGQVIASQDPNARIEPASLTKIMTAYRDLRRDPRQEAHLDQMINVSVRAWKVDASSSKMFIDPAVPRSASATCCTA